MLIKETLPTRYKQSIEEYGWIQYICPNGFDYESANHASYHEEYKNEDGETSYRPNELGRSIMKNMIENIYIDGYWAMIRPKYHDLVIFRDLFAILDFFEDGTANSMGYNEKYFIRDPSGNKKKVKINISFVDAD